MDDFGLYSIPTVVPTPSLGAEITPTVLLLTWPTDATGYILQGSPSLSAPNWTPVEGVSGNSVTVPLTGDARLFRLYQP